MGRRVATVVFNDDTIAHARHHVIGYVEPGIIRNTNALTKNPEVVIYLVVINAAIGIFGAPLPIGIDPDSDLTDIFDDVVIDDGVGVGGLCSVDPKLGVNVGAV